MNPLAKTVLALAAALLSACGEDPEPMASGSPAASGAGPNQEELAAEPGAAGEYAVLDWEALIPPEWHPDKLTEEYDVANLADDDPRARELMAKLQALWKEAPVVPSLDGKRIRLPGFVVPIEADAESVGDFLLVPYYGACIHVPPPPANQTVHVVTAKGGEYHGGLFDTVWVNGTLKVQPLSSELGDAGYRIDAVRVEPYGSVREGPPP
jgi:uncharacterized protein